MDKLKLDPTGCQDLRERCATHIRMAVSRWRNELRAGILETDGLNLDGQATVRGFTTPADRLAGFATFAEVGLARCTAKSLHEVTAGLKVAYRRGNAAAAKELHGKKVSVTDTFPGIVNADLYTATAKLEANGIAAAGLQVMNRIAATSINGNTHAVQLYKRLQDPVDRIVLNRLKTMASTLVTTAYNGGKLDTYQANGLTHVGLIPEHHPAKSVSQKHIVAKSDSIVAHDRVSRRDLEEAISELESELDRDLTEEEIDELETELDEEEIGAIPPALAKAKTAALIAALLLLMAHYRRRRRAVEEMTEPERKRAEERVTEEEREEVRRLLPREERAKEESERIAEQGAEEEIERLLHPERARERAPEQPSPRQRTTTRRRRGGSIIEPLYIYLTAGDEKVCAVCEDYEGITMTLDEARALIPQHPNCRCSVIPAWDQRYGDVPATYAEE